MTQWMKRSAALAVWVAMLGLAAAAPLRPSMGLGGGEGGDEKMQSGTVTLPWADAKEWLKDIFAPDDATKPPAGYLLESAVWTGEIKDNHVELTAECVFTVLTTTGWVKVPVASAQAIVKSVRMDGNPVGLHEENGLLHIVTNEPGRHSLAMTLVAAASGSGKSSGAARLPLAPFPQNNLTINLPSPDYDVVVPQSAYVEIVKGEGSAPSVARAVFGRSDALDLRWERKVTVAEGAKVPTKISSRTFSLFTIGEGLVAMNDRINYSILYNPVSSFRVEVPVRATITSVEGPGVKGWNVETPADKKAEKTVLEVTFAKETKGEGYFIINRELPLKEDVTSLPLPIVHPLTVERNTGWVGVSAAANVECKVETSQKLTQTDVEEAPAQLGEMTADPLVLVFKYTDGPLALTLGLRRFETLPVLTTIVDHADYTVLLTEDGKVLTRTVFQTRNNRNQYLQVALPEGAAIWSSFVAGEPVKPAMDDKGHLLLLLKKSFTVSEQTQAFPVEVIYLQELGALESRARLTLSLARPDVPVSRAFATLLAPEDFKLRGFKGTLKKLDKPEPEYLPPARPLDGQIASDISVRSQAEMEVAKEAKAGLPARRMAQAPATVSVGAPFAATASAPTQSADWAWGEHYGVSSQMKTSRGLLPIPIDIPAVGKPYYFGKILTTDEPFELTFTYRKKWLF